MTRELTNAELAAGIAARLDELRSLRQERDRLKFDLTAARNEIEIDVQTIERLIAERDRLKTERDEAREELSHWRDRVRRLGDENHELVDVIAALTAERDRLKGEADNPHDRRIVDHWRERAIVAEAERDNAKDDVLRVTETLIGRG